MGEDFYTWTRNSCILPASWISPMFPSLSSDGSKPGIVETFFFR